MPYRSPDKPPSEMGWIEKFILQAIRKRGGILFDGGRATIVTEEEYGLLCRRTARLAVDDWEAVQRENHTRRGEAR